MPRVSGRVNYSDDASGLFSGINLTFTHSTTGNSFQIYGSDLDSISPGPIQGNRLQGNFYFSGSLPNASTSNGVWELTGISAMDDARNSIDLSRAIGNLPFSASFEASNFSDPEPPVSLPLEILSISVDTNSLPNGYETQSGNAMLQISYRNLGQEIPFRWPNFYAVATYSGVAEDGAAFSRQYTAGWELSPNLSGSQQTGTLRIEHPFGLSEVLTGIAFYKDWYDYYSGVTSPIFSKSSVDPDWSSFLSQMGYTPISSTGGGHSFALD